MKILDSDNTFWAILYIMKVGLQSFQPISWPHTNKQN